MPLLSKKKKVKDVKPLPYAPENKFLNKAEAVAKEKKRREVEVKTEEYKKKLMGGEEVDPESPDDIEVLESELGVLVKKAAEAEAMADSEESESKAKKLKKQVVALKTKITKAKKTLKE